MQDSLIHNHFIDKLAFINGFVSGVALYPQVWTVLTHGAPTGVSITSFLIILINSVVWVAYSVHRGLFSLGVASLLNTVASAILVFSLAFV